MTEHPTITQALAAASRAVRAVEKDQQHNAPGGANFKYRGIDQIVDAVSRPLAEHGVVIETTVKAINYEAAKTSNGKSMWRITGLVRYRFHGPAGDHLSVTVPAESFDSGDKGTAKFMSVALRTALLQTLLVVSGDRDADADSYQVQHGDAQRQDEWTQPDPALLEQWRTDVLNSPAVYPEPGTKRDAFLRSVWNDAVKALAGRDQEDFLFKVPDSWSTIADAPEVTLGKLIAAARVADRPGTDTPEEQA